MSHELLLEWVSERGSGSWDQFKRAHAWLFGTGEEQHVRPSRTIGALSLLAHLEIDWKERSWAAAPPALTLLPSAGARALLTGSRTRALVAALEEEALEDASIDVISARYQQEGAPDAFFIGAADESHVERLASELGVAYEFSVSERLSQLLPPLDTYLAGASVEPPPRGYGIERFNTTTLRWVTVEDDSGAGLFRYDVYGRPQFRFRDNGHDLRAVDMSIGIYAELRRDGRQELLYEREEPHGTLTIPVNAPLPDLHARAAALCSGLMPALNRERWQMRYRNVPRRVAQRISTALGQELRG